MSVIITSENIKNIRLVTLVSNVFKYYDTSVALFTKYSDKTLQLTDRNLIKF